MIYADTLYDYRIFTDIGRKLASGRSAEPLQETKIVIVPSGNESIFAFWEISQRAAAIADGSIGGLILRVTASNHAYAKDCAEQYDIEVSAQADNTYFKTVPDKDTYRVKLGVITDRSGFITLACSNTVTMPEDGSAPISEDQYSVLKKAYERLMELSGVAVASMGSNTFIRKIRNNVGKVAAWSSSLGKRESRK